MLRSPAVPELPEVETVRASLAPHLTGRRVEEVSASRVRLREPIDVPAWERHVVGARLASLVRRGKYLVFDFERAKAVLHLGMSGRIVLASPVAPTAVHTHLRVVFEGEVEMRLVDPRRFGLAVVVPAGAVYPPLAALGPEPLEAGLAERLRERAARSRAPIRNVLLDQSVIAGMGNIYVNEALARAGIDPLRPASQLSSRRLDRLADEIQSVLREALTAGGTTLADRGFAAADGTEGLFAIDLRVYGREGRPCRACGAAIRRRVLGGRSVFLCPRCQR